MAQVTVNSKLNERLVCFRHDASSDPACDEAMGTDETQKSVDSDLVPSTIVADEDMYDF